MNRRDPGSADTGGADNIEDMQNSEPIDIAEDATALAPEQNGAAVEETGNEANLAAEYLEALQRERAAFINYRRRTDQERGETVAYANASLLKKLLPVVDDFDRALLAIPEHERKGKGSKWVEGIELIARKLHNLLEQEGVEPIEAKDQPFDPNLHEAVAFEEGDGSGHEDTVSEVFSKGYKLRDRVLRPAMVKVTRG